jgi:hypothetical protein
MKPDILVRLRTDPGYVGTTDDAVAEIARLRADQTSLLRDVINRTVGAVAWVRNGHASSRAGQDHCRGNRGAVGSRL